ncbi:hypothetical protein HDU86_007626 [Geranomyces michiganensis]|nr:hypothetical protein HDU86_007626 [Geranomyces michiganensis]
MFQGFFEKLATYANSIECVDCLVISLTTIIEGCNEGGICTTAQSSPVRFTGVPPSVGPLAFSATKIPYDGKLWYTDVTTALFNTTIRNAAAPGVENNIVLRIAVNGYADIDLTTLFDIGALHDFSPPPRFQATALSFTGQLFHNEAYVFTLRARTSLLLSAEASATIWLDETAPFNGTARIQNLIKTPGFLRLEVTIAGFYDFESGIKELWTRVDGTDAACAANFGSSPSWVKFTDFDRSYSQEGPAPAQKVVVDMAADTIGNWTQVYFAVAVVNHAWTNLSDSNGVAYQCLEPLSLQQTNGSIIITQIDVEGESDGPVMSGDTHLEVHWLATDIVSGFAFLTANLTSDDDKSGKILQAGPFYDKASSITLSTGTGMSGNITVCLTATTNALPMETVSACKTISLARPVKFDSRCVISTVVYDPLGPDQSVATGTASGNFSTCVLSNSMHRISWWLVRIEDFFIAAHGDAAIADGGILYPISEIRSAGAYKWCFMASRSADFVGHDFCAEPMIIDPSPARPLGGVYDAYAGHGLDPLAVTVRTSSNVGAFLVTWDDWSESESGILVFQVSLVNSMTGQIVARNDSVAPESRAYLFKDLNLKPGESYYASLIALNLGGLASKAIRSPGAKINSIVTTGAPRVSVDNGFDHHIDQRPVKLFLPRNDSVMLISWSGFTGSTARVPVFMIELAPKSGLATTPKFNWTTSQSDLAMPVPIKDDFYKLTVTLIDPGSDQVATFSNDIWVSERLTISPPVTLFCDVDFQKYDTKRKTVPLSASWNAPLDAGQLITVQTISFRRLGQPSQSSGKLDVSATSSPVTNRAVTYLYDPPSAVMNYSIECVWTAVDLTGASITAVYNGFAKGFIAATSPAVFAVSTWNKVSRPSSASDFDWFSEVSITPNSSFLIAMQSFPPVIANDGTQLALLSYAVFYYETISSGEANQDTNSTTQVVTFSVPWTEVDVNGAQPLSLHRVAVGSSLIPIAIFEPTQFVTNGGFPSDLATVFACVNATTITTNATVVACSNGVMYDSLPPTQGTVSVDDAVNGYLTDVSSFSISWRGFVKPNWPDGSGIAEYAWAIGSFAGADDYVPFSLVSGLVQNATVHANLADGTTLYVTVTAFDQAGRAVQSTSAATVVDTSPPLAIGFNPSVLTRTDVDGSTFVRVSFPQWRDDHSGVALVTWAVESAYKAADVLAPLPVTYSNMAYANLQLLPGASYLVRLEAINGAGLNEEVVLMFTTDRPVQLIYLVDGSHPSRSKLFDDGTSQNYSCTWQFTGEIVDFVVGIGSAPRQDDMASFKRMDPAVGSLTLPIPQITDGVKIFTTVFLQDSSGNFRVYTTPGMLRDSTPPLSGWVTVGGFVHKSFVASQSIISAAFLGFSDAESDITGFEYCLDLDEDVENAKCKISPWALTTTDTQLIHAPIIGSLLPLDRPCYVKIKATNAAGLSIVATSPEFFVEPAAPLGGEVSVSFPGYDPMGLISPISLNGTQLYLDKSCLNVSWNGFTGNIEKYRVALFRAPGTQIRNFTAVGTATSWAFANLTLSSTGSRTGGYFAVVQAWNAAGLFTERIRFFSLAAAAGDGTVKVTSVTASGISFYIGGFTDPGGLSTNYSISLGRARYGGDVWQQTRQSCAAPPCSYQILTAIEPSVVYFLSVWAVNEAGLVSKPALTQAILPVAMSIGATASQKLPFQWNITADVPFTSVYQPTVFLRGVNLSFFLQKDEAREVLCKYTAPNSTALLPIKGSLQISSADEREPVLRCPSPSEEIPDGGHLTLTVEIANVTSNALKIWRRDRPPWNTSEPRCGLYRDPSSSYRISTALAWVSWATDLPMIAFWKIKRDGVVLDAIYPSSARQALVLFPKPLQNATTLAVCASFDGDATASGLTCVSAKSIQPGGFSAPTVNNTISTEHEGPLSTAVRVIAAPDLLPLSTSQYIGLQPVAVTWEGTFDGSIPPVSHYLTMIGASPGSTIKGSMILTTQTSANFSIALTAGIPYFATVIATNVVGLQTIQYSSAFIADVSPPDVGRVHIGKRSYAREVEWQTSSTSLDFYLSGWSDHISGIAEFFYRVCNSEGCTAVKSMGLAVDVTVPAALDRMGAPYWVSVQAMNGANRISNWVNSSILTIDNQPPEINEISFTGIHGNFIKTPITDLTCVWKAVTGRYAPILASEIQIGTTPGGGQLLPPTNVGTQQSFSLSTLSLTHNTVIYVTIRATSQNGLSTARTSSGLRTDFTKPLVRQAPTVLDNSGYATSKGGLTVTARWDSVFEEPESPIVRYEWAIGTPGLPSQYSNGFLDAGAGLSGSYFCAPADESHFVVTVRATNLVGLSADVASIAVLKSATAPNKFSVSVLNEGALSVNGSWVIPSSVGRFSFDNLADVTSGLADVLVEVLDAATNATLQSKISVGVTTSLFLQAEDSWTFRPLKLHVLAVNNVGLSSSAFSFPFILNTTEVV